MIEPLNELLEASFDHFRCCGAGQRECVVFWTGPLALQTADAVVHPAHTSGPGGYEINVSWLKRFWLELYEQSRTVRVQVHTHPRTAFHSPTDDAFPASQREGFLSLVVPDFGLGEITFENTVLFELGARGEWRELDPLARLQRAA